MINKKLTALCLAVMGLGLVSCGGETGESFSQRTDKLEYDVNLQIVGNYFGNWTPSAENPHFTYVEGTDPKVFTLTVELVPTYIVHVEDDPATSANEEADVETKVEFKFTENDTWANDFGFGGLDPKSPAYADFTAAGKDADGNPDPGSNIVPLVAGTYKFEFRYWYAMEAETYGNKMRVERVTAAE